MNIDEFLIKLNSEGNNYMLLKEIPNRGICGIHRMLFTVGLMYNIDEIGYEGRYCYNTMFDAMQALNEWDGIGDAPGDWIKHKSNVNGEYANPKLINNEH